MASEKNEKVQYIGQADVRHLKAADFTRLGAKEQGAATWGPENDRALPVKDFTDEALAYLKTDPDFRIG